ncbi:DMT family transporter [Tumidithrix helvetica PCC 7403]|uniref:DMT family transporter n=1 Tax=Tumidithrix helvetica TaxID=3457545 RepID=UPI003CAEA77F
MPSLPNKISDLADRFPGRAYLILAILIFSASGSIVHRLSDIGMHNLVHGRNPISFCNVLFVGNLCALLVMLTIYYRELNPSNFAKLSRQDWSAMTVIAILDSVLVPALFFTALSNTLVNNVVLIGRIEPPLSLALAIWILRERVNGWVIAGAIASFVGVVLTIVLQQVGSSAVSMGGFQIGKGELQAIGGATCLAIAILLSKITLKQIPVGIFTIYKTALGTIVFFVIATILFGFEHFAEALSPLLWQWMFFYGAVIVVGGQICWLSGLKKTTAAEVSLASSFSPIIGILAAYAIVGEIPSMAQYIGAGAIVFGIGLTQIGTAQQQPRSLPQAQPLSAQELQDVCFKGV